ncbi:hypothetical protein Gohar_014994 [Gossypium harknessii]|uniref:Uncharacterized protein n=1 Tax=Gossypium harknessii TaxID=34285 RepID=A0A7J9G0I1_9ROSI|nr:hypothetical protein [Gossypium harknessii]
MGSNALKCIIFPFKSQGEIIAKISMGKGWSLQILLTSFMILLNTIPAEPKSVLKVKRYFHSLGNVTVIANHAEFKFLHSSNVQRMLAGVADPFVTQNALMASEAAFPNCGRGQPYVKCLPHPNDNRPRPPDPCGSYKRANPCPLY